MPHWPLDLGVLRLSKGNSSVRVRPVCLSCWVNFSASPENAPLWTVSLGFQCRRENYFPKASGSSKASWRQRFPPTSVWENSVFNEGEMTPAQSWRGGKGEGLGRGTPKNTSVYLDGTFWMHCSDFLIQPPLLWLSTHLPVYWVWVLRGSRETMGGRDSEGILSLESCFGSMLNFQVF